MRTSRISIGVLTLIIVMGMSQRAMPLEQTIVSLVEPASDASFVVKRSPGDVDALRVPPNCETIGAHDVDFHGINRYRGDRILITRTSELTHLQMDLVFFGLADLYFTVHEQCDSEQPFFRVAQSIVEHQGNEENDGVPRTFSSDEFDPPVRLFAGCTYAFGVAWAEDVAFLRDNRSYPTSNDGFEDGDVLGSTSRSQVPPMPAVVQLPTDPKAYLMHLCLAPKPGACCLGPNVCQDMTQLLCEAADGAFTAERFLCADLLADPEQDFCPLVKGGCCLPGDGGCFDLNRFACENEANAGIWHAEACATDPCPPRGACCRDGEDCSDETETACFALDGVYQGDETTCDENGLQCSTGACCSGEFCAELTDAECAGIPGVWQKSGSRCEADTCDPPGACCLGDSCEDELDGMNAVACAQAGGIYQGDFSTCETLPANCGLGACCAPGIGCVDLPQQLCEESLGGSFAGNGTACATLDPQCAGTCCWDFGCLSDETPSSCAQFLGGVFGGYEEDCESDPGPCADAVGGCCLDDGSCIETTAAACSSLDGGFDSLSLTCSTADPCVDTTASGACCLLDGRCAELTEGDCGLAGGSFAAGVACTVEFCVLGVCCHDDSTCDSAADVGVTIAQCLTDGGNFYSGPRDCEVCPKAGACCLPDDDPEAPCDTRTRGSCEGAGGSFDDTVDSCPLDPTQLCSLAACCQDDGSCTDTIEANCPVSNYNPGVLCDQNPGCPIGVACCLPNRDCAILTAATCTGLDGRAQDEGTDCEDLDICTEGACCVAGECRDDLGVGEPDGLTIAECEALGGVHQGEASECIANETCTEGACCIEGLPCQDGVTITACAEAEPEGTHQGIGTECDGDLCTEGACCVEAGVCEELTIGNCFGLIPSGTYRGLGTKCDPNELCTEGPCCVGGLCETFVTVGQCTADGGTHLGLAAGCDGTKCLQGACCLNDGACRDDVVFDNCRFPEVGDFAFEGICDTLQCAPAGACCLDNSICEQLTLAKCADLRGTHFGDGLNCADGSCPGACCFEGGSCLAAGEEDCETGLGEFVPGTICQDIVCGGSCCHPDGTCEFVSEGDCDVLGGDIFSADQTCAEAGCEARGACCSSIGCSELVTESACTSGGGLYLGDLSLCDASICDQGGCCLLDGTCEDGVFRVQCSGVHDDFQIGVCGNSPCVKRAACCIADEACQILTQTNCENRGGEFAIAGTNCDDPSACISAPCCLADDRRCGEQKRIVCERDGGVYRDDLVACDSVCERTGEPCVEDINCRTCQIDFDTLCTTDADCTGVGDSCTFTQSCVSAECTRGACCDAEGDCVDDQYENDCKDFGDGFFSEDVCNALNLNDCDEKRACCKSDGTCEVTTRGLCVDGGGQFSVLLECSDGLCDVGACCLRDGSCRELNGRECADPSVDGVFQGGETSCEVDPTGALVCHACCTGDQGSCFNSIPSVCTPELGTYDPEANCTTSPCAGACCDKGQCTIIDRHATAACAGVYLGNDTLCDPGLCDLGACCGRDGICADRVIESVCGGTDGFFRRGVGCGLIRCDAEGACCENGACTQTTQANCGGIYQGDGTVCESETCDPGSCCAAAGVGCTDSVLASQCAALGDEFRLGVTCAQLPCTPACGMGDLTGIVFADDGPIAANAFDQPGHCAIDARQPYDINNATARAGWDRMVISFSCDPTASGLVAADFTVSAVPVGAIPGVLNVTFDNVANTATVMLDDKITPGQWTCITHLGSASQWCMGYLPADAGQDGVSSATDISKLINSINLVPGLEVPVYAGDANRSGQANGQDILRLIDLLNGAGEFNPWISQTLLPCPAP